jgi:hypothetical protein
MDVTDKIIRSALKLAATALEYPERRGIPIERVNTHLLRIGRANALHLAGYAVIERSRRWGGGAVILSKNMFESNCRYSLKECHIR